MERFRLLRAECVADSARRCAENCENEKSAKLPLPFVLRHHITTNLDSDVDSDVEKTRISPTAMEREIELGIASNTLRQFQLPLKHPEYLLTETSDYLNAMRQRVNSALPLEGANDRHLDICSGITRASDFPTYLNKSVLRNSPKGMVSEAALEESISEVIVITFSKFTLIEAAELNTSEQFKFNRGASRCNQSYNDEAAEEAPGGKVSTPDALKRKRIQQAPCDDSSSMLLDQRRVTIEKRDSRAAMYPAETDEHEMKRRKGDDGHPIMHNSCLDVRCVSASHPQQRLTVKPPETRVNGSLTSGHFGGVIDTGAHVIIRRTAVEMIIRKLFEVGFVRRVRGPQKMLQFVFPDTGGILQQLTAGRKEVMSKFKRCRHGEMMQAELERRSYRNKKFSVGFLIRDLVGKRFISRRKVAGGGFILRLIAKV